MISLFTKLLKDFFVRQAIAPADRIMLGPPDRTFVGALPQGQTVSIYLADIRENRKLRSNERVRQPFRAGVDKQVVESLYPAWVDAHYVITAWDSSADQNIRALKEHELLSRISSNLLAGDPFTPREVYPDPTDAQFASVQTEREAARATATAAGKTLDEIVKAGDEAADKERTRIKDIILAPLNAWPEEFRLPGLPYQVLPPEGFPKLSEFWTTMGGGSVWKPIVYLVAAIPVELKPKFESPMVTTMSTTIGQWKNPLIPGTERTWFQIGGYVLQQAQNPDGTPKFHADGSPEIVSPVKRAKVTLLLIVIPPPPDPPEPPAPPKPPVPLQETRTDDEGKYQFLFAGPLPGDESRFQVIVQAPGLKAVPLEVVLTPAEPFPHDILMRRA